MAHLVKDATRGFLRSLQARLAAADVQLGHWTFLRILWERDGLTKRELSVEAGVKQGWRDYVGDHGKIVSIDNYGASADYARIYEELDITGEAVANAARDSLRILSD